MTNNAPLWLVPLLLLLPLTLLLAPLLALSEVVCASAPVGSTKAAVSPPATSVFLSFIVVSPPFLALVTRLTFITIRFPLAEAFLRPMAVRKREQIEVGTSSTSSRLREGPPDLSSAVCRSCKRCWRRGEVAKRQQRARWKKGV